ncbi:Ima1 N-terminal domain-containing protein [Infundibulicybe gibba]|nr:Ima1 N-terminal domain-containing protein [Infundibulicybe gibba]
MAALFRRRSNMQCFFCQSSFNSPNNPRNFRCPACGCRNIYDDYGEIISDEPAMHDETLNSRSFSKRASPSKDRLPTTYGKGPFCHTCQTNQTLLINLLSNYLPSPSNPEYEQRLQMLPEYRESLHVRYPPVCDNCLPAVEDEIRSKDTMARTKALGGWLKESRGKEQQRRVSGNHQQMEKISLEMAAWKMRGCLWVVTLGCSLFGNSAAAIGRRPLHKFYFVQPVLPLLVVLSLLWTVWDPTYASARRSQLQGRDVRVKGKQEYIVLQLSAWFSRLITATLLSTSWFYTHLDYFHFQDAKSPKSRLYFFTLSVLELIILIASSLILRLQHPPTIRLIDTRTHTFTPSRSATPNPITRQGTSTPSASHTNVEPGLIAALSLSSKPIITKQNPIFGLPSLPSPVPAVTSERVDPDEMDWMPTEPSSVVTSQHERAKQEDNQGSWLRPQKFFAPEQPTGLESLFERTRLIDDTMGGNGPGRGDSPLDLWKGWWIYMMGLLPIVGITAIFWQRGFALN